MTYEFLKSLYSDIMAMVKGFVPKRPDLAYDNETTESAVAFELYYACLNGSTFYWNFKQFDLDLVKKYVSPAEVSRCYANTANIPESVRPMIVADQSKRVIENYVESNEYYRMLAGLPPLNDSHWVYVKGVENIPEDTPIHELTMEQISRLEVTGELDKIKAANTDKSYLNYLGANSIDFVTARLARPYAILRLGSPSNNYVQTMFENEYHKARIYIMATAYKPELFTTKTLFYPTIGVLMLALAIRNTLVPTEAEYLNFEEILDAILESYDLLQYFKSFPYTFKRRLVLALDAILQVKGTDGVLVDICKIFSMENFEAKRYYLMRTHMKDIDGNVQFTGDIDQDIDLNFVKTPIEDHEISYGQDNIVPYEQVVNNDYLWQLTEDEKHAIMNEDFNLMMTKYIDIEAAYDVTALTFEVCGFLNLLLCSRANEMKIRCVNMYATGGSCDLYTMIIFLLAGLAKRSRFDGNIVYDTGDIAQVLRFNYGDIADAVQEVVDKYELEIDVDDTLLPQYVSPPKLDQPYGIVTDQRLVEVYVYNRELYKAILSEMHDTTDIRKYIALSNAKDCMYYSYMQHADFLKSDGSYAKTYYEMLWDVDPKLASKLDSLDPDTDANDLDKLLVYVLEKLEDLFSTDELKYLFLNTPSTYGSLIEKYLRIAINVFKASSVQLDSINVFFNMGDHDPIRVIDQKETHENVGINDTVHVTDELAFHHTVVIEDYVYAMDKPYTNT